jgi:hypothetical protein
MSSSFFERLAKSTLKRVIKEAIDKAFQAGKKKSTKQPPAPNSPPTPEPETSKTHPWRLCPVGQHWVVDHELNVAPSSKGPGYVTLRHGHCRRNSGKKELYTAQEFREIAHRYFAELKKDPEAMPAPDNLGFPHGNDYDLSIAGWTKFWNETLKPERPVTPDFIKVLISTESSFEILPDTPSNIGPARGLIQITEATRKILQDPKGELRDHLIALTAEESRETEPNIAAGIRWLYHKRFLLEHRLKRKVSWEEAAAEYKGIFGDIGKDKKTDEIMDHLNTRHKRLTDLRKKGKEP